MFVSTQLKMLCAARCLPELVNSPSPALEMT
jgi:hypothetical protein